MIQRLESPRKLEVTGHRGHSTAAPENTRAAIAAGRRLIQHGIDNVITDYPERAVKLRDRHKELSDVDRLLLAYRSLLDL